MLIVIFAVSIFILLFLSGWFSSSESALTDIDSSQIATLQSNKTKNIDYLIYLKKHMDKTLITILLGNNVVNILLSSLAALLADQLFHTLGVSIMIGVITFLVVIFGEISPKSHAIMNPEEVALKRSKAIYILMKITAPIIWLLLMISRYFTRRSKNNTSENLLINDKNIKDLATLGEHQGVIKKIEKDIIHQVFNFGDRKIIDIVIPMQKVFAIQLKDNFQAAKHKIAEKGFTRIPVMHKNRIVGIIYSKDLIAVQKGSIKKLMHKPYFVRSQCDITDIFLNMRKRKVHLAVITNQEKEHIGIVTLEDILEELVGNIYDEYYDKKFGK
ncbi:MAG: hemolysin family protein [Candidatus Cloacimonetes bacterium]|nr:hemolysin family protein [Candidatus Cloacimonadota bacterium]MCF7814667.1 hemolysin family protein [Candidatus Cloacimonadota bacterium]MCF7869334.1 hemolysin family protein [Candidatus Cloacimonadota bacterium]MCF7884547.1 hemolysin family protein [Candidatus Cloacimonadota bacterium]